MFARAFLGINILFFALSAFIAADIVLVALRVFLASDKPSPALAPLPPSPVSSSSLRPVIARQSTAQPSAVSPTTSSLLQLTGVVPGNYGYAVFSGFPNGQMLFRVGQSIEGYGRLTAVDAHSAILTGPGGRQVYRLADGGVKPVTASASTSVAQGNRRVISRESLLADMNNLQTILKQVSIQPWLNQGRVEGFSILNIPVDSVFGRFGFYSGDVVQQINGVPLTDMDVLIRMMQQIKDAPSVSIDILRGQLKQTLQVEVR